MKPSRLPDSEFAIMQAIWALPAPVTVPQVMDTLGEDRGWKPQTMVTLFGRLVDRGFLRKEGEGRGQTHRYFPLVSRDAYLQMETQGFLSRLHQGSLPSLIASLRANGLTHQEREELSTFIQSFGEGSEAP